MSQKCQKAEVAACARWAEIGAVGSIIVGMLIFSEPTDLVRILCLTLIVADMVGLGSIRRCELAPHAAE